MTVSSAVLCIQIAACDIRFVCVVVIVVNSVRCRMCLSCIVVLMYCFFSWFFFFQAEDGIRDLVRSRGLGDVYKRQHQFRPSVIEHHILR